VVSIVSGGVGRGCGCGVKVIVENHETCELNESMVRDLPAIALQPVLVTLSHSKESATALPVHTRSELPRRILTSTFQVRNRREVET